jgi:histone H3/H4
MTQSPKLEVPEARGRERSGMSGIVFVLLLIVLVVQILSLFVSPGEEGNGLNLITRGPTLSIEEIREAALELERKNVCDQAAELWTQYLEIAGLSGAEEGNIRYRIGKNHQNAGAPAQAYAQYVLAEMLLAETNPDLREEIGRRRRNCLRDMGRLAELAREVAEQARPDGEAGLDAVQVVAEVGDEKITLADFERMLSDQIELAVKARPGISADEARINRERYHEQLRDPQRRADALRSLIVTRVLAQEARKQEIHQTDAFRERIGAMADGVLAQSLLFAEISKRATVTDADIERFYTANSARYEQPAASFIAHIQCADEATARAVLRRVEQGEAFGELAKRESRDADTRGKFGIIPDPVPEPGDFVPIFGNQPELHQAIRAAAADSVLPDVYTSPRGWHVIQVVSHRARIVPPLEEIAERVRRDTLAARQAEVTDQYITQLQQSYAVKLFPAALTAQPDPVEDNAAP